MPVDQRSMAHCAHGAGQPVPGDWADAPATATARFASSSRLSNLSETRLPGDGRRDGRSPVERETRTELVSVAVQLSQPARFHHSHLATLPPFF